jgi:hypothetical protein
VVVAARSDDGCLVVGRPPSNFGDVRVDLAQLVEHRGAGRRVGGSTAAVPLSAYNSWLNPNMRLPTACITWWVRSTDRPPPRNIAIMESM